MAGQVVSLPDISKGEKKAKEKSESDGKKKVKVMAMILVVTPRSCFPWSSERSVRLAKIFLTVASLYLRSDHSIFAKLQYKNN